MKELPRQPAHFPAYYDHKKSGYLLDADHGWTHFNKEDLRTHMIRSGWDPQKKLGLSQLDYELMRIQTENKIDYWGPVAGHKRGLVQMGGCRVLVTESYSEVIPVKGDWGMIQAIVENLFDRVDKRQKPIFYSWLKIYLESLRQNIFMPGQAMILVGPRNCGKSFLQNRLTTLFGGRSANPWMFIDSKTTFNSDLFAKEHLQSEDPPVNCLGERLEFSSNIKQFTVNEIHPCHPKSRDIVTLQPRWRLTISINDAPYHLRAIPPIDDSTADKLIIFKCHPNSVPFTSTASTEREAYKHAVEAQLPAFAHFLLHEWQIPVEIQSGRFGVTHFHHPEILEEINHVSPEKEMLCTFDENDISDGCEVWKGTIKQLTNKLLQYIGDPEALKLSKSERTLALRMASAAKKYPERVRRDPSNTDKRIWIVTNPRFGRG